MIRRLGRTRQPLTIRDYVQRATLGLPKAERLDAATELRMHLLERRAEYEAKGYSPEEAEFLAVRGMGEVAAAHPQLWRERLLALGWPVLALLLLSGAGWYGYREWLPPKEGIWFSAPTPADTNTLFNLQDAPRGSYQAATLTLPKGTRTLVYVNVASPIEKNDPEQVFVYAKNIANEMKYNIKGRVPNSYRYQERWLWTTQHLTCHGKPALRFYLTAQTLPSPFWNTDSRSSSGMGSTSEPCQNPNIALRQVSEKINTVPPEVKTRIVRADGEGNIMNSGTPAELRFRHWTVLARAVVDPQQNPNIGQFPPARYSTQARGVYLAVMPLPDTIPDQYSFGSSWGGGKVNLSPTGPAYKLPSAVPHGLDLGIPIAAQ